MKRVVLLALVMALCASVPAQARLRTIAPPGNSGVGQYDETIPTAGGSRPTNTVHPVGGTSHGSGGGGAGGSTGTGGGGSISSSTQHALAAKGPVGAAAAALAKATAPSGPRRARSTAASGTGSSVPTGSAGSPVSTVIKAVTGSASSGGPGPLLPVILVCSLLGATALALLRRRRMS
jgi:hypothetical protein